MKVLVVAISQPSSISGVQRHAFNLVRCLLQRPEIKAVHMVLAPWQLHLPAMTGLEPGDRLQIEITNVGRGSVARNRWHVRDLPKLAREVKADLVQLSYPVPFRRAAMPCPVVMTLHDLYPFEVPRNFGFPQVLLNQWILRLALRQADAVACVSGTTLRSLQHSKLTTAPLRAVIPNCVEPGPESSSCGPLTGRDDDHEPFLLTVAQHRRNKNLDLLLRTFGGLLSSGVLPPSFKLVIVGVQGPETQRLHTILLALGLGSRVDFLEGLSDPELQWCYTHCAALVAPSSIEGFGLPVVEARLAGCRVVCSDIPAFRELAGPEVHLVDLRGDSELNLNRAIVDALAKPRPAPELLPEFAVDSVADAYLKLYRTTLNQHVGRAQLRRIPSTFEKRQTL